MKNTDARTNLKLALLLACFSSFAFAKSTAAGDYYIYRDPNGKVVISNSTPPAGSKILKKEIMPEVTDEELAASRKREEKTAIDDRIASLERTIDDLAENLRAQRQILGSLQQDLGETNIAVGVSQGAVVPRSHSGPHEHTLHSDNSPRLSPSPRVVSPRVNPPRSGHAG
jgi:hypothetical protein